MLGQRGPLCFPTVGGWAVRPIERRGEVRQRILLENYYLSGDLENQICEVVPENRTGC